MHDIGRADELLEQLAGEIGHGAGAGGTVGLAWEEPRAVGDLAHVEKFFVRNLGGLIRARTCAGPAREGNSRTPSMYADEKSDEAVVLRKRPNKGRQLPAEVVEGRASPKGNSRQAAVVRTLSRDATSIRLAAVRRIARGLKPRAD